MPMRYTALQIAEALGNPGPTAEQQAVIEAPLRPLLVVAGAGSGKTETMASRVVWLVANGHVEPDQVLGLTFTRKAATELAERIARRLRRLRHVGLWTPDVEEDGAEVLGGTPTVSTYHSYAGRLVREHVLRLGIEPESRLLSEAAAWQFAAEVVERYDGPMDDVGFAASTVTAAVVDLAGEMAEHLLGPDDLEGFVDAFESRVLALPKGASRAKDLPKGVKDTLTALRARRAVLPLVRAYLDLKRSRDALDFSDQMALAARLARSFPDIGAAERSRFRAVLLDEFQDTSEAQLVLLQHLYVAAGEPVPVTAVGDPNQSIYGWRGASATTLTRFPAEFADDGGRADELPLSTSWRNDDAILRVANLTSESLRLKSPVAVQMLRPKPGAGPGRVQAARLLTAEDEAAHVASWIRQHWLDGRGARTSASAAVLCRKRSQFPSVIDALEAAGLPVEVVGLGGLLTTPEVSDIVALLWVVQDPSRGDHLMRLLTGPLCRLGAADLDGLAAWARFLQRRDGAGPAADRRADGPGPTAAAVGSDAPAAAGTGGSAGGDEPAAAGASAHVKDQAVDSADRSSIVEALDELPPQGWRTSQGQHLSAVARQRLLGLREAVRRLRSLTGMSLADLVGEAERALGLDIEVLARPGAHPDHGPRAPRRVRRRRGHLRRQRRPAHAGRVPVLARRRAVRGARARQGHHRGVDGRRPGAHRPRRQGPGVGRRGGAGSGRGVVPRPVQRGHVVQGRAVADEPADRQGLVRRTVRGALRPARRPRRVAGAGVAARARPQGAGGRDEQVRQRRRRARHRGGAPAGLRGLHPGPQRAAADRARVG